MSSLNSVRELQPGERPRDWIEPAERAELTEEDFGKPFVERARDSSPHESWAGHDPEPPIEPE